MAIREKLIKAMSLNVVLWLAMLTAFTGLLACAGGVYLILAERFAQPEALMITGGGLLAIVALVVLFALLVTSGKKASEAKKMRRNPDNILEHQLRPVLGDQATNWVKHNTGITVVGALSAGVLLAASPRLRSLIVGAASPMITRKAIQALQEWSDDDV